MIESAAMNSEMIFEIKTLEDVMAQYLRNSMGLLSESRRPRELAYAKDPKLEKSCTGFQMSSILSKTGFKIPGY